MVLWYGMGVEAAHRRLHEEILNGCNTCLSNGRDEKLSGVRKADLPSAGALLEVIQEGLRLGKGGVDLQGLLDRFDGRFLFFFRCIGSRQVVQERLVVRRDAQRLVELGDGLVEIPVLAGLDAQGVVGMENEAQEVFVRSDEGPGLLVLPLVDKPHDGEGAVFLAFLPVGEFPCDLFLGDAHQLPDEGQRRLVFVLLESDGAEGVLEGGARHELPLKIVDAFLQVFLVLGKHAGDDHPLHGVLEAGEAGVDVSLGEKLPAVCQGSRNLGCPFSDDGFVHAD
jgi:hypothetical protein